TRIAGKANDRGLKFLKLTRVGLCGFGHTRRHFGLAPVGLPPTVRLGPFAVPLDLVGGWWQIVNGGGKEFDERTNDQLDGEYSDSLACRIHHGEMAALMRIHLPKGFADRVRYRNGPDGRRGDFRDGYF